MWDLSLRELSRWLAQQQEEIVEPRRRSWFVGVSKRKELPESLERRKIVGAGRIEDQMKPPPSLGEALVLTQVGRDGQREMKEHLPVVVCVGPAGTDVDLLHRKVIVRDVHRRHRIGIGLVELLEEGRIGQAVQGLGVHHVGERPLVEGRDQAADERMKERFEGIGKLGVLMSRGLTLWVENKPCDLLTVKATLFKKNGAGCHDILVIRDPSTTERSNYRLYRYWSRRNGPFSCPARSD